MKLNRHSIILSQYLDLNKHKVISKFLKNFKTFIYNTTLLIKKKSCQVGFALLLYSIGIEWTSAIGHYNKYVKFVRNDKILNRDDLSVYKIYYPIIVLSIAI